MKYPYHFISRVRKLCSMKQGKSGASLGLVVIIGAALAIWVIGILPMMMGTGTTAAQLANRQDDYLYARSAVEFTKSELEKIVETDPPYTFVVVNAGALDSNNQNISQFAAIPKANILEDGSIGAGTNPEYLQYVAAGTTDMDDVPSSGADGNKVAAICAVAQDPEDMAQYNMVITTYSNREEILTYTATYTLFGSLKINPEAYKQIDALPLDDYVLVDGILGGTFDASGNLTGEPNVIWNSDIEFKSEPSSYGTFHEWLLPVSNDASYANAAGYTAIFKMTAEAAKSEDATSGNPVVSEPLTGEGEGAVKGAIKPAAVANEEAATKNGDTWIEVSGSTVTVKMRLNGSVENLTSGKDPKATVYYNGYTSVRGSGSYMISVDVSAFESNGLSVMAVSGLANSSWPVRSISNGKSYTLSANSKIAEENGDFIITVEVSNYGTIDGLQYGYTYNSGGSDIQWTTDEDNEREYDASDFNKPVYFYVRRPAVFDDGVFYPATNIAYAGMVVPFSASKPTDGGKYMIIGSLAAGFGKNSYYAMLPESAGNGKLKVTELVSSTDNPDSYNYVGKLNDGYILNPVSSWTFDETNDNNRFWVTNGDRYLSINQNGVSLSRNSVVLRTNSNGNELRSNSNSNRRYLKISSSNAGASSNTETVYFIAVADEGATDVKSGVIGSQDLAYNAVYDNCSFSSLWAQIESDTNLTLNELYLNYRKADEDDDTSINVGTYNLVGNVNSRIGSQLVSLGTLTVTQGEMDALTITATPDQKDALKVTVSSTWNTLAEGQLNYFGYSTQTEDGVWSDFQWFTSATASYDFRLPVGSYKFAVAEHISGNYAARESVSAAYTIQWKEIAEPTTNQFNYKVVVNHGVPEVTWYEPMPDGITPDRLTMVYGIYDTKGTQDTADDTIAWSLTYPTVVNEAESVVYGLLIAGTKYKQLDDGTLVVYQLSSPQNRTNIGGHQSSGITAKSLYFMGESISSSGVKRSLMSYGNDIELTADLIVFKHAPSASYTDDNGNTTTGEIVVHPTATTETGKVLLFSCSAFSQFEAGQFYILDAGTDILNPQEGQFTKVTGKSGANKVTVSNGTFTELEFCKAAETMFRKGEYPEPDLNILFATNTQLLAIVSSETIGWTNAGVLSGSDKSGSSYRNSVIKANAHYAVCTYVNKVSGDVSRVANRVFLTGKDSPSSNNIQLTGNTEFCTRYLCIDASQVSGNNVYFKIYNLTEDQNIIEWFSELLNVTKYISKTLQLEYEQSTNIYYNGASLRHESAKVGRCDNGLNLFSAAAANQDLLVDYTISEIESWFGPVTTSVQSVERYLSIDGTSSNQTLDVGSWIGTTWKIYANYIYFGPNVTRINVNLGLSGLSNFDLVTFNSQEYGYTEEDYLGFFRRNSEESYAGTIVYFDKTVTINVKYYLGLGNRTYVIDQGFYYVYATDDSTKIIELTNGSSGNLASGPNPSTKRPYVIREEDLADYTVYINPKDGTLSNAYVEPGIYGSDSSALGGFSGGNVE